MKYTALEARRLGIKNKTGVQFTSKSIRNLLGNQKYIGRMEVVHGAKDEKRTWVNLPHGEVVPKTLFDRVQARLGQFTNDEPNQNKFDRRVYLLAGILKSPDGSSFTGQSAQGQSGAKFYYYWNTKSKIRLYAEEVEEAVFNFLLKALREDEQLVKNTFQLTASKASRINFLEANRKDLKSQMEALETEKNGLQGG